jgi:N-acetylglucosamine repressor
MLMRLTNVKNSNKMNVLQFLRLQNEVTKPDIAKIFGYSAPTVSKLVDELVAEGYAKVNGRGMSTDQGGKRPTLYAFNPMGGAIVSLHIGPKIIEASLVNLKAKVLYRLSEKLKPNEDADRLMQKIMACIEIVLHRAEAEKLKILAIGIGCPGLVDFRTGKIISSYGLQKLEQVEIGVILSEAFGYHVWIDNECNNLALAEQWFGEGEMNGTMINLMIEEGVGAGIIIENQMIRGENNSFGEVGHMVIDHKGLSCSCGNRGCWEQYVSIDALIGRVAASMEQSAFLRERIHSTEEITIPLLAQALQHGDEVVNDIAIVQTATFLATGISSLINIFNPNHVILHGSLQPLEGALLQALKSQVRSMALPVPAERAKIRFSSLGKDSHIVGAATLGMKGVFEMPEVLFGEAARRG